MIPIEELTSLEELCIHGYQASLQKLKECPSLTRLYFLGCDISRFDSIDHLLHLTLNRCQGIDWSMIANAPHLETLTLHSNFPKDISIVSGIQNLRRLTIALPFDIEYQGQRVITLKQDSFEFIPYDKIPFTEEEISMLVFEKGITVVISHDSK